MADWYLAPSLTNLRSEVNLRWPNRDKTSDGTVGDLAHQTTNSDHNPNTRDSVDAWDMDRDGVDPWAVIYRFERHPSSHYWIFEGQIADRDGAWVRRPYTGSNPHTKHVHFSIRQTRIAESDMTKWGVYTPPKEEPMATVEEIWSAAFGTGENRRTAGELLAENRKIPGVVAKTDTLDAKVSLLAQELGVAQTRLQEIDAEATARAEAEVTRDSELAAQLQNAHVKLDELKTMLDAHDNGSLSAEAVVRRMGELLSEPTTPDQG